MQAPAGISSLSTQSAYSASPISTIANGVSEEVHLTVITYDQLTSGDLEAIKRLRMGLLTDGVIGIRGIPNYRPLVAQFIESAKFFASFDESVKSKYAPNRATEFLGYEVGKEKFARPDGTEVVDDLKESFYVLVPDHASNKWPIEVNLRSSVLQIGALMEQTGKELMQKIGLLESVSLDSHQVGRVLHYRKESDGSGGNPFWCGAHFDHGIFTALLPAVYFDRGQQILEPQEAGLFVRGANEKNFKKVRADDPEVMLFQVGEFGQLATNDQIKATEHRVHKASGSIERFTMALFFSAPSDCTIQSTSVLTSDSRYGANATCTFKQWNDESLARYLAQ